MSILSCQVLQQMLLFDLFICLNGGDISFSVLGSIIYTYITFVEKRPKSKQSEPKSNDDKKTTLGVWHFVSRLLLLVMSICWELRVYWKSVVCGQVILLMDTMKMRFFFDVLLLNLCTASALFQKFLWCCMNVDPWASCVFFSQKKGVHGVLVWLWIFTECFITFLFDCENGLWVFFLSKAKRNMHHDIDASAKHVSFSSKSQNQKSSALPALGFHFCDKNAARTRSSWIVFFPCLRTWSHLLRGFRDTRILLRLIELWEMWDFLGSTVWSKRFSCSVQKYRLVREYLSRLRKLPWCLEDLS